MHRLRGEGWCELLGLALRVLVPSGGQQAAPLDAVVVVLGLRWRDDVHALVALVIVFLPLRVNANVRGHTRFAPRVNLGGKLVKFRAVAKLLFASKWTRRPGELQLDAGLVITLKRIAPKALDAHDNLPQSMKPLVDGIADALGLTNDRDERVTWRYAQERRGVREYAVEVFVRDRASLGCSPCPTCGLTPNQQPPVER